MRRLACILLIATAFPAAGLQIEQIDGAGWQARDLRLQLNLSEYDSRGRIELSELHLPEPWGDLRDLRFDCDPLIVEPQRIACLDAPLTAKSALLDKPAARASIEYTAATGVLRLELQALKALGGTLSLRYRLAPEGWQAVAKLDGVQASRLAPMLKTGEREVTADAGQLDGEVKARGNEQRLNIDFDLGLSDLTAYDAAGDLASEKLALRMTGNATPVGDVWHARLNLKLPSGQLYVNPVFMDLGNGPLSLVTELEYAAEAGTLRFDELELEHQDTLSLAAAGQVNLGGSPPLQELRVTAIDARLARAYPVYLQPFLIEPGLDELDTQGRIQGELQMLGGGLARVALTIEAVTAHDRKQRFSVDALNGEVNWSVQDEEPNPSQLSWSGGSAYKLPFGPSELHWQAGAQELALSQPFKLPLLGGALQVGRFRAAGLGSEALSLEFDAALEPLQLKNLTRALGWPEFTGTLSGQLPDLSYADGSLTVGGTLAAAVFDGRVQVEGLRIDNPFGRLPRLAADIRLRNLDLAQATSAFDFGAIEGRLDGDVQGLRLLNWQPAAFDARLYTPQGDDSRHRISQRAIETISSLGGAGAGAALSRGFMRFFENFAYDRLGISCRLANAVCLMGGIEAAPDKGGYYLVKGKLVPRIDVIGYAREVSWPVLIEQLRTIAAGEGPVVR